MHTLTCDLAETLHVPGGLSEHISAPGQGEAENGFGSCGSVS